ncbi:hypothetical protein U0070_017339 [Myodes glareolus]|uniref:VPS35 endosomal protein-sorting factor-like n=1 Tax=Myodes glareolus TaxID=447135 RepID=A0AAW0K385_MYOGA
MAARAGPSLSEREKRGWPLRKSDHVTGKMAVFPWHSRNRNYKAELASCRLETVPLECGDYHPLKPITVTESKTKKVSRKGSTSSTSSSSSSSVVDPLSSVLDGTDPLSMFAATSDPAATATVTDSSRKKRDKDDNSFVGPDFEPWANKRGEILARYTTTEKLAGAAASAMSEKVRTRLEELDDFEEGSQKELLNLTQQDYVNRIEELNQSLKDAWASDQKVKALKIVIQCSKLLSDTSVIQFYPSKFVLITDILDTFGKLVYERIYSMCVDSRSALPAIRRLAKRRVIRDAEWRGVGLDLRHQLLVFRCSTPCPRLLHAFLSKKRFSWDRWMGDFCCHVSDCEDVFRCGVFSCSFPFPSLAPKLCCRKPALHTSRSSGLGSRLSSPCSWQWFLPGLLPSGNSFRDCILFLTCFNGGWEEWRWYQQPGNGLPRSPGDTWFCRGNRPSWTMSSLTERFCSYVEASILKCNKFLSKTGISECLPRLTSMIRGIGDPLVSVYARAYLCRVGMEVAPHLKESLNKNFFDFLLTFKQIHGDTVQNQLVAQGVELLSYLPLYSPAMGWIFQCVSYHAPEVRPVGAPLGSTADSPSPWCETLLGSFSDSFSIVCASCLSGELSSMGGWFYAHCLSRLCPFLHWEKRSHLERLESGDQRETSEILLQGGGSFSPLHLPSPAPLVSVTVS